MTKKKLVFLLVISILFPTLVKSQTKRFYYQLEYKQDTIGTIANDVVVLDILIDSNIFLSEKYIEIDSINSSNKINKQYISPVFNKIIKYHKSTEKFNFYNKLSTKYYVFETDRKIKWKLTNQRKKIGNFEVQKAIANYGERNWTAWFCKDIPLSYGPYVFYGLPGLILEVYDENSNYKFSFMKNKNYPHLANNYNIEEFFDEKIATIDEKDWKKLQINYYKNPLFDIKDNGTTMYHNSGEEFSEKDYKNLELKTRNYIEKYNNPIEISEKINYKYLK